MMRINNILNTAVITEVGHFKTDNKDQTDQNDFLVESIAVSNFSQSSLDANNTSREGKVSFCCRTKVLARSSTRF